MLLSTKDSYAEVVSRILQDHHLLPPPLMLVFTRLHHSRFHPLLNGAVLGRQPGPYLLVTEEVTFSVLIIYYINKIYHLYSYKILFISILL